MPDRGKFQYACWVARNHDHPCKTAACIGGWLGIWYSPQQALETDLSLDMKGLIEDLTTEEIRSLRYYPGGHMLLALVKHALYLGHPYSSGHALLPDLPGVALPGTGLDTAMARYALVLMHLWQHAGWHPFRSLEHIMGSGRAAARILGWPESTFRARKRAHDAMYCTLSGDPWLADTRPGRPALRNGLTEEELDAVLS